ncbi:MAG TPA: PDZ domain-containing protein [Kofleriaceae bacterium]|nr:PDZ domain-containing protein [Kofleriaceae bacterium]
MRVAVGLLAALLAPSIALAEDAAPVRVAVKTTEAPSPTPAPAAPRQKVPVRVVKVLRDTNQALLFDRSVGTHVLVTVGQKIGIYTVETIDDDEVTLSASGQEVVLAAPDRPWRRRGGEARGQIEKLRSPRGGEAPAPADPYTSGELVNPYQAPSAGAPGPADPYQAPSAGAPGPADPYSEEIREVKAPSWIRPDSPAPRSVQAPAAPAPAAPAPVAAPALAPAVPAPAAPAITPAPAAPAAPAGADPVLARREVDAALADFGALATAFHASFTPAGVQVDAVSDGSLFAKAGLRAGDVIAAVDGKPLRSLNDVAALYARAGSLRAVTAQVVRNGKPLTLRVIVQ